MSACETGVVTRVLASRLLGATGSAPSTFFGAESLLTSGFDDDWLGDGARTQPTGEGAVAALEVIGLLSPDEAATWGHRFDVAKKGWAAQPPAGAEKRAQAHDHLARILDQIGPDEAADAQLRVVERFGGAFALLRHVGCVGGEDARDWAARVAEVLGRPPEYVELEAAGVDLSELDDGSSPSGGRLLRVIAVPPARHEGLCVTSVELYENWTVINWHQLRDAPVELEADFVELRLEDDAATAYGEVGQRSAGWSERPGTFAMIGASVCPTPVPSDAAELRVSSEAGTWLTPLR